MKSLKFVGRKLVNLGRFDNRHLHRAVRKSKKVALVLPKSPFLTFVELTLNFIWMLFVTFCCVVGVVDVITIKQGLLNLGAFYEVNNLYYDDR